MKDVYRAVGDFVTETCAEAAETGENLEELLNTNSFEAWLEERGFVGEIWPCYEEWLKNEGADELEEISKLYWVNGISESAKGAFQWAFYEPCLSLEEALKKMGQRRMTEKVLFAWVTNQHGDIVFHGCFVDTVGNLSKPR